MLWSSPLYIQLCLHFFSPSNQVLRVEVLRQGCTIFRLFTQICQYKFCTPKGLNHSLFAQTTCEHACSQAGLNSVHFYPTSKPLIFFFILLPFVHSLNKRSPSSFYVPASVLRLEVLQRTQAPSQTDRDGMPALSWSLCDLGHVPPLSLHFLSYKIST